VLLKNLAQNAKLCLLWSTGTEEGLPGGPDAASSRISKTITKKFTNASLNGCFSQFFESQKKGPGGGRRKIDIQAP
jgi:hypothetical protein